MEDTAKAFIVFVLVFTILALCVGAGILIGKPDGDYAYGVGRKTHQCEVVGEVHKCRRYSARAYYNSCACFSNEVWITYPNTYLEED
jgi:hypothetical protein